MRFGRIGVLAGGPSSERDISLKSGTAVYNALKNSGFDVQFIDIKGAPQRILERSNIDIAFIALHGGFGEDGTIQGILEKLDTPYTGSGPRSSRLALDKIGSRKIFIKNAIPTPEYLAINKRMAFRDLHEKFGLPLVVKPQKEGSSIGLSVVRRNSEVKGALDLAFRYSNNILIEKFIKGRELTVGILNKEALPVIEILSKKHIYDYGAKYLDKKTEYIVPARIENKIYRKAQDLGIRAHRALGCRDFSRVDMKMDKNGNIFVLEVNTIPGLTERSLLPKAAQAADIGFGELCVRLLELALCKKGVRYGDYKKEG
ncbi:MAG: D-alanine--D-alanine ligase [Candidatus Omnitrophica bacterium]|nr:D-alanine--D-alanine ligase [Candidatus Omnitrophota bacterium]